MQQLLERGEELFREGKLDEAESCFRTLLNTDPNSQTYNLGVLAYQQGRSNEAAEHFINAIRVDSSNLDAVFNLCEVMRASDALCEAAGILEPLVRKYPDNRGLKSLLEEAAASCNTRASEHTEERPGPRTLRVLHGTCEVANQMYTISRGLQGQGITAETLSYYPSYLKYRSDHTLDINAFRTGRGSAGDIFAHRRGWNRNGDPLLETSFPTRR